MVYFTAEFLGFDHHIAPYAAIQGTEKVLQGVNYASGSAGIRPQTGKIVVIVILLMTYARVLICFQWFSSDPF